MISLPEVELRLTTPAGETLHVGVTPSVFVPSRVAFSSWAVVAPASKVSVVEFKVTLVTLGVDADLTLIVAVSEPTSAPSLPLTVTVTEKLPLCGAVTVTLLPVEPAGMLTPEAVHSVVYVCPAGALGIVAFNVTDAPGSTSDGALEMLTPPEAASAPGTSEQTMTIAMNSDSSLRFIDFIKYPSFLMSGGTRPTGQAAMAACRISLRPYYTTRLWKVRIETVSFLHHFLIPAALRAFQPGPMVYWTEKRGGRFPGERDFFSGGGQSPALPNASNSCAGSHILIFDL